MIETAIRHTPLYHAQNEQRYQRQDLIRQYQQAYSCRLIVVVAAIYPWSVTLFEELVCEANPNESLHLLLGSPGGDGEAAVRIVRAAQARSKDLTIIVPDSAKSAGTLLTLGANEIIMGPTSDLGPVDPQIQLKPNTPFVAAKDVIAAVEDAAAKVQAAPGTYALYSSLLADVSAVALQQARSAVARTKDLIKDALTANPDRTEQQIESLASEVHARLVERPHSHAAVVGAKAAREAGLPVREIDASDELWQNAWNLWTRYFQLGQQAYESASASQIIPWSFPNN